MPISLVHSSVNAPSADVPPNERPSVCSKARATSFAPLMNEMGVFERRILETAARFAIEEGIEGNHVLDFDGVDTESGCNCLDCIVTDMTEALLNRVDNIHEAGTVGPEFLDDAFHRGPALRTHRPILAPTRRS